MAGTCPALHLGVAACFLAPDAERDVFRGKRLGYFEEQTIQYLQSRGDFAWLVPTRPENGPEPEDYAAHLDGLVLQGGSDVAPQSYGEQPLEPQWAGDVYRDRYELALIAAFRAQDKPIFGICRGLQVINVALGGRLYQDLPAQCPGTGVHRDAERYDRLFHELQIEPGTRLAELYRDGAGRRINSIHHQAVSELGNGLIVEARSVPDGVIEAVRYAGDEWLFGVQWHPEFIDACDTTLLDPVPLLDDFRAACRRRKRAAAAAELTS